MATSQSHTMVRLAGFILATLSCLWNAGCGGPAAEDSDTAAVGPDCTNDTMPEVAAEPESVCLNTLEGYVVYEDGCTPVPKGTNIQVCNPNCRNWPTDENGKFTVPYPLDANEVADNAPCHTIDYSPGSGKFIDVQPKSVGGLTTGYAAKVYPTQAAISDLGPDDYVYNVGTFQVSNVVDPGVAYTIEGGASVDFNGISFELPVGALDVDPNDPMPVIKVFVQDLTVSRPRFDYVGLDALAVVTSPYKAVLTDPGIAITMPAPSGWANGETGTLYLLGEFPPNYFYQVVANGQKSCVTYKPTEGVDGVDFHKIHQGELAECGVVTAVDGKIVTPPIPMFTWFGVKK